MAATPPPEDFASRIAALENAVAQIRNVSPTSITVTDRNTGNKIVETGYDSAHSNRSFIKMRDSAGDIIFANDTVAGWGYTTPNTSYGAMAVRVNSTASAWLQTDPGDTTNYWPLFVSTVVVNSPRINWVVYNQNSGGTSPVGKYDITWSPIASPLGNHGPLVGTAMTTERTLTGTNALETWQGSYLWPTNMYGQVVMIGFWAHLASGGSLDWASTTPQGIWASGQ